MKRLYSLDSLRGLAALSVVFWHWQHFYAMTGTWQAGWRMESEPLYQWLLPLYQGGWAAVDLFFPLSGFIFFWLYGQAIRERRIGGGEFALLRFSRLWPLHFAMLLAAALLQLAYLHRTGVFFIYKGNDWPHFLSSILMAQQWLPPSVVQSFDGPAWSVSVEVLLYVIFFAVMRLGLRGSSLTALSLGLALAAIPFMDVNWFIARGVVGFFIGGAIFYAAETIKQRPDARKVTLAICAVAVAGWIVLVAEMYLGLLHHALYWLAGHVSPAVGRFYIGEMQNVFLTLFILTVSPLTILALALHEQVLGGRYKRLSFLGDISYSTYLIHFPLQLAVVLVALRFGIRAEAFMSPFAMAAFFAVLIGLGTLSFHYFERPLQSAIRGLRIRRPLPAE